MAVKDKVKKEIKKKDTGKKPASEKTKKGINNKGLVPVEIKSLGDHRGGHPHVITAQIDNKLMGFGLTKSKSDGKGGENMPLEKDPLDNLKAGQISYLRTEPVIKKKSKFRWPRIWLVTPNDQKKLKEITTKEKKHLLKKGK